MQALHPLFSAGNEAGAPQYFFFILFVVRAKLPFNAR